jgi:hypothetical protein
MSSGDGFGSFWLFHRLADPIRTKFLTLPARSSVFRGFRNERTCVNIPFRKIEEISRIIQRYHSLFGNLTDASARLPMMVAIDAIGLNPALAIQSGEGTDRVLAAVAAIKVSDQQIIEYSTSLRELENWAKNNSQNAITDTFALLMQPLDPRLPCTLLHR